MKGYRTIVMNILMAIAAIASIWGFEISPDDLEKVATGIVTAIGIMNLILRKMTTTPMGQKE